MKNRKGIILAGGSGTRLYPLTMAISKQLMPVYDKPMIYYPLYTLMLAGIREVLIITTPRDNASFRELLGDGSKWGMRIEYMVQDNPNGLAEAFILGEEFIGEDNVALILGDNLFYGENLRKIVTMASSDENNSTIFGYQVKDPERYGVVEMDAEGNAISIVEKPENPRTNLAVPGLYFYTNDVVEIAKNVQPSERGELEITSVNEEYMRRKQLKVVELGRGMAWFDTGTHDALIETAQFVQTIQKRQGMLICSPDELAFENGWINREQLKALSEPLKKTEYGQTLKALAEGKEMYW
ncbi:MAG: glucose-1-phosphate thymidylyltransferase RfbA [Candidatus Saccharibacteria bacterium]|nr:glucose-1-phosphate thymidylyltransferase RfbA [Candidatus Saccharibacteria bacterium]